MVMQQSKSPLETGNEIRWHRVLLVVAILCGFTLISLGNRKATDGGVRPVKDLSHASNQIHWPQDLNPATADAFVHNEIWINAPASVIWQNLIDAKNWPGWYANSADVRINGSDLLKPEITFTWKTFGFPVTSKINEFEPESRIGWFGEGTGIRAYHTWLILERSGACQVVTEETQVGPSAVKFNLEQPTAMFDGHDWWLSALKVRSESAASK